MLEYQTEGFLSTLIFFTIGMINAYSIVNLVSYTGEPAWDLGLTVTNQIMTVTSPPDGARLQYSSCVSVRLSVRYRSSWRYGYLTSQTKVSTESARRN